MALDAHYWRMNHCSGMVLLNQRPSGHHQSTSGTLIRSLRTITGTGACDTVPIPYSWRTILEEYSLPMAVDSGVNNGVCR